MDLTSFITIHIYLTNRLLYFFVLGSHTCFFTIDLPAYSTTEIMFERLNYAINYCSNIDGDGNMNEVIDPRDLESDSSSDE